MPDILSYLASEDILPLAISFLVAYSLVIFLLGMALGKADHPEMVEAIRQHAKRKKRKPALKPKYEARKPLTPPIKANGTYNARAVPTTKEIEKALNATGLVNANPLTVPKPKRLKTLPT